jgi:hypothetical protein
MESFIRSNRSKRFERLEQLERFERDLPKARTSIDLLSLRGRGPYQGAGQGCYGWSLLKHLDRFNNRQSLFL